MERWFTFLLVVSIFIPSSDIYTCSFTPRLIRRFQSPSLLSAVTIQELKDDPFIKQVSHAAELCERLSNDENEGQLDSFLIAQLSHSDGIRGFFVQYLTTFESPNDGLPQPLQRALTELSSPRSDNDLLMLACMNVVMPAAMTTMHTETRLQQSSLRTAQRGAKVLQFLATLQPAEVSRMVATIVKAATSYDATESISDDDDDDDDDKGVAYWKVFYDKYGYGPLERANIVATISSLLETS